MEHVLTLIHPNAWHGLKEEVEENLNYYYEEYHLKPIDTSETFPPEVLQNIKHAFERMQPYTYAYWKTPKDYPYPVEYKVEIHVKQTDTEKYVQAYYQETSQGIELHGYLLNPTKVSFTFSD